MSKSFLISFLLAKKVLSYDGDEVVTVPGLLYAFLLDDAIFYCVKQADGQLDFFQVEEGFEYRVTVDPQDRSYERAVRVAGEGCQLVPYHEEGKYFLSCEGYEFGRTHLKWAANQVLAGIPVDYDSMWDWKGQPLRKLLPF